jgi:hypothetical protein
MVVLMPITKSHSKQSRILYDMCSALQVVVCPFVVFLMAIILSVLRFTTSDYRMCNVKLFLWQYVLLVEGNQPTCHKAMTFLLHLVE